MAEGTYAIKYIPSEWVEANPKIAALGYGLFVFDKLNNAKEFAYSCYGLQIWKCHVQNVHRKWVANVTCRPTLRALKEYVKHHPNLSGNDKKRTWPEGTKIVDKVKLIERVKT